MRYPGNVLAEGGGPRADPGFVGEIIFLGLLRNVSVSPLDELEQVVGVREVWASLLRLLAL